MNLDKGYLYFRLHESYDKYDVCKLGIASNIPDRDSTYSTGEIKRGYFELVFEVPKKQMRIIENLLKCEFAEFNIRYDGGTEFYDKKIIDLIEPVFIKYGILYKKLTKEEIDNQQRCYRAKKIISRFFKLTKLKKFIKNNQLNKYIDNIKKRNIIKDENINHILHNNISNNDINYLKEKLISDQIEILLTSIVYYHNNDKGIWNLFCRYGKTRLSCLFCKMQKYKKILILVPSLYLINQTYDTWKDFFDKSFIKKVCSEENNTNIEDIHNSYYKNDMCIFISTYHSSDKLLKLNFDICIYDEAHRTTGQRLRLNLESNAFLGAKLKEDTEKSYYKIQLENKDIKHKLFLTATTKQYTGRDDEYYTMDDETIYGKIIAHVSAKKARELNRICNYEIITIELTPMNIDFDIEDFLQKNNITDKKDIQNLHSIKNKYLMCAEGLFQTMENKKIKHVITFHELVINCKFFKVIFEKVCYLHNKMYNVSSIDGTIKAHNRNDLIQDFQDKYYSVLCSAKVLQEGVDIPKCDGVIFIDVKTSIIDTVQSLSRCLTFIKDKQSYIMIPYDDKTDLLNDEYTNNLRLVLRNIVEIDDNVKGFFKELLHLDFESVSDRTSKILDELKLKYNIDVDSQIIKNLREISYVTYYEAKKLIAGKYTHENDYKMNVKNDFMDPDKNLPIDAINVYKSFGWRNWNDYLGLESEMSTRKIKSIIQKENENRKRKGLEIIDTKDKYQKFVNENKDLELILEPEIEKGNWIKFCLKNYDELVNNHYTINQLKEKKILSCSDYDEKCINDKKFISRIYIENGFYNSIYFKLSDIYYVDDINDEYYD